MESNDSQDSWPDQETGVDSEQPVSRPRRDSVSLESAEEISSMKIGDGVELEHIVEDLERSLIEQSLAKTNGNKTEAAKLLGISFRSMRYRLKKYNME